MKKRTDRKLKKLIRKQRNKIACYAGSREPFDSGILGNMLEDLKILQFLLKNRDYR